jgi:cytochrome c-type biogenesis protein CcsB
MKKISNLFLSMTSMGVLLLIFAASIAVATFIENDFGTPAAHALVYNATWFNLLLALLAINLIANIFREKMYRKGRFGMLLFHVAFLIILLGSAITRFVSYEGMIHLRNGETSNTMVSDRTYVGITATQGTQTVTSEKPVLLSELTPTDYHATLKIGDKKVTVKAVKFIQSALKKVIPSDTGDPAIMITAMGSGTQKTIQLIEGQMGTLGAYSLKFGGAIDNSMINLFLKDGQLQIMAPDTISYVVMGSGKQQVILPHESAPFVQGNLYTISGMRVVVAQLIQHAKVTYVASGQKNSGRENVLMVRVTSGNETKEVGLQGGDGFIGENNTVEINGVQLVMSFGAKIIKLPFSLKLNRFELKRYPGSMSPSSYASEVTVIDPKNHKEMPFRIYMNHVLNYEGYRFFQSSYDMDEQGSILSVNHDYWGTLFTYLGYFLMALGMVLALINRNSRFAVLGRFLKKASKTRNTALLIMIFLLVSSPSLFAQHKHLSVKEIPTVTKQEAATFGKLITQSPQGRFEPMNTLSSQLLRKIAYKSSFQGLNPDQVFLGMMGNALYWKLVPIIKVSDKTLKERIGITGNYASFLDFIDVKTGNYKLSQDVQRIDAESPSKRNQTDKDILKVDERVNICYMIFQGDFLKLIPDTQNPDHSWYAPSKHGQLSAADSMMLVKVVPDYLRAVAGGNAILANGLAKQISNFQKQYGGTVLPSQQKISAEILYNKWMIFDRLSMIYGTIGFIMIILLFIDLLRGSKAIKFVLKIFLWIIVLSFIVQTFGLILRWYISGHAPWSDGYESMIYIAWVTMLAGLIFSRRSMMSVAATTILGSIILMVAHLSWMDPEITNLVPVLKSYWLTIHVSVITASYGFLALSALLGFFNLILSILKSPKNKETIVDRIRELTAINERSLTIGLYMLTMGTFLGGIWANESWGRYWGWDPKETWALVSVLIYSFIAHMHRLPGLKSQFSFNLASLLGYSSILMTFFGVNYYLSGLHSYAKGDAIPVPNFVYYTVVVIVIVAIWAYWNERRFKEKPIME